MGRTLLDKYLPKPTRAQQEHLIRILKTLYKSFDTNVPPKLSYKFYREKVFNSTKEATDWYSLSREGLQREAALSFAALVCLQMAEQGGDPLLSLAWPVFTLMSLWDSQPPGPTRSPIRLTEERFLELENRMTNKCCPLEVRQVFNSLSAADALVRVMWTVAQDHGSEAVREDHRRVLHNLALTAPLPPNLAVLTAPEKSYTDAKERLISEQRRHARTPKAAAPWRTGLRMARPSMDDMIRGIFAGGAPVLEDDEGGEVEVHKVEAIAPVKRTRTRQPSVTTDMPNIP